MRWLIALLLCVSLTASAQMPSGFMEASVTQSAVCELWDGVYLCAIVEKDGDTYFVALDTQGIKYIFAVEEDDDLDLIWSRDSI